jgi:hypothetical protein
MRMIAVLIAGALLTVPAAAQETGPDNPWYEYCFGGDTLTTSAGNASAANTAIHAVNPWPRAAQRRNIPASGERMAQTIRRYKDVSKIREAAQPPTHETDSGSSSSAAPASTGK